MVKLPTPDSARFDKRMIERLKVSGKIKEKEVKDFLNSLPDETQSLDRIPIWSEHDSLPSEKIVRGSGKDSSAHREAKHEANPLSDQGDEDVKAIGYDNAAANVAGDLED